jgi:MFS family permease
MCFCTISSNIDYHSGLSRYCSCYYPQALSIIQTTFTSKERNIALVLFGTNVGIAAIAAQILGGFLVQTNLFNFDWRLIFLVNLPIGIGTLIAASRIVHESKSEKSIQLDIGEAAILSIILFLLLYPLIEGRNAGWPLWMYGAIILSIILIFPFILFESEHNDYTKSKRSQSVSKLPLMPLSLFKDRGFVLGTSIVLVFFLGSPSIHIYIVILSTKWIRLFAPCLWFDIPSDGNWNHYLFINYS